MKMVCVVFCASLLGTHICRESCLPKSSTQALPNDAKWQSIQISPPSRDGVDQIPKGGEQKSMKCPTYAQPPPPPLGLTLIGALQNLEFFHVQATRYIGKEQPNKGIHFQVNTTPLRPSLEHVVSVCHYLYSIG